MTTRTGTQHNGRVVQPRTHAGLASVKVATLRMLNPFVRFYTVGRRAPVNYRLRLSVADDNGNRVKKRSNLLSLRSTQPITAGPARVD